MRKVGPFVKSAYIPHRQHFIIIVKELTAVAFISSDSTVVVTLITTSPSFSTTHLYISIPSLVSSNDSIPIPCTRISSTHVGLIVNSLSLNLGFCSTQPFSSMVAAFVSRQMTLSLVDGGCGDLTGGKGRGGVARVLLLIEGTGEGGFSKKYLYLTDVDCKQNNVNQNKAQILIIQCSWKYWWGIGRWVTNAYCKILADKN